MWCWMVGVALAVPNMTSGPPDNADEDAWIQLDSGEWLSGDFTRMKASTVEFDSNKMNNVTFPWREVISAYVSRSHDWKLKGGLIYTGSAILHDEQLTIRTSAGDITVRKSAVQGITEGTGKELSYWGLLASMGLTSWFGNTQQLSLTSSAAVTRETARTFFKLFGEVAYGTTNKEQTTGRYRGTAQVDFNITGIFYLSPAIGEVYSDRFQNIGLRVYAGSGIALRQDIKGIFDWNLGAYVVYQYLRPTSSADQNQSPHGVGLQISFGYSWDITDDVEWDFSWASTFVPGNLGTTSHTGTTAWDIDITNVFSFTPSVKFNRVERPPVEENGRIPKQNDVQLIVGLSLDI